MGLDRGNGSPFYMHALEQEVPNFAAAIKTSIEDFANQALGSVRRHEARALHLVASCCSPLFLSAGSRDLHQIFLGCLWRARGLFAGGSCLPTLRHRERGACASENGFVFIQQSLQALFQMKRQSFFSPSYTRFLFERRQDACTLLIPLSRFIPQFALYSLSLGIGAAIARLSPDRGVALVEEAYPSASRSSSTAQRGAGDNSTSFLEMQLAAYFC